MTREQIEKAARIERENVHKELQENYRKHKDINLYTAFSATIDMYAVPLFKAGAQWRINSVWHNKHTVIPDSGRLCLLELKDPDSGKIVYKVDSYSGYEWKELTHYECSGLIRFAYIDDLLSERKEDLK